MIFLIRFNKKLAYLVNYHYGHFEGHDGIVMFVADDGSDFASMADASVMLTKYQGTYELYHRVYDNACFYLRPPRSILNTETAPEDTVLITSKRQVQHLLEPYIIRQAKFLIALFAVVVLLCILAVGSWVFIRKPTLFTVSTSILAVTIIIWFRQFVRDIDNLTVKDSNGDVFEFGG